MGRLRRLIAGLLVLGLVPLGPAGARRGDKPGTVKVVEAAAHCRADLAERLRSTDRASQLLTVEAPSTGLTAAHFDVWQHVGACWSHVWGPWPALIGWGGFSARHREGDGTTPIGIYPLGVRVYGNLANPGYRGPYHKLVCGDWWDEDPLSPQYNTFQHVPCGRGPTFGGDSEALWMEGNYYPAFIVVLYNVHPVVPYAGSAIFVHASTGPPTTGCVSIPWPDLVKLLRWLRPAGRRVIAMGPLGRLLDL